MLRDRLGLKLFRFYKNSNSDKNIRIFKTISIFKRFKGYTCYTRPFNHDDAKRFLF